MTPAILVVTGASGSQWKDCCREPHLARLRSILVRVVSCDFVDRPCFSGQTERSTKPHELNTKLVTIEIDF